MNAEQFIKEFVSGTLKRERMGTLSTKEGEHCKIMIKTSTTNGQPHAKHLMLIRFDKDFIIGNKSVVMGYGKHNDKIKASLAGSGTLVLEDHVFKNIDEHILESGIIDRNAEQILFEIGDTPYLFFIEGNSRKIIKLDKRMPSLKEANESLSYVLPGAIKDSRFTYRAEWVMETMPSSFIPQHSVNKSVVKFPSPLDFGIPLEMCRLSELDSSVKIMIPIPRTTYYMSHPIEVEQYEKELKSHKESLIKFTNTFYPPLAGLHRAAESGGSLRVSEKMYNGIKTSVYDSTTVVTSSNETFIKGWFSTQDYMYNLDSFIYFDGWHKLIRHVKVMSTFVL